MNKLDCYGQPYHYISSQWYWNGITSYLERHIVSKYNLLIDSNFLRRLMGCHQNLWCWIAGLQLCTATFPWFFILMLHTASKISALGTLPKLVTTTSCIRKDKSLLNVWASHFVWNTVPWSDLNVRESPANDSDFQNFRDVARKKFKIPFFKTTRQSYS